MKKLGLSVSAWALVAGLASAAQAQSVNPAEEPERGGVADIVVTAQKRAESLSKTPVAISVVGQGTLDSLGARDFKEVVSSLPSVSANGLGGTIAVRGLGTNTLGAGNGTVAYHLDGIFQTTGNQSSGRLFDIQRVEVLRGPQGTLYGRNATAGVVNVLTNNANLDKFEAFGDVSYARYDILTLRGAINLPVNDMFALRLTSTYEKGNNFRRGADGKHIDGADVLNLRLAWRAQPSDRITWDGRLVYNRDRSILAIAVPTYIFRNGAFIKSSNARNEALSPAGTTQDGLAFRISGIPAPSVYRGLSFNQQNRRPSENIDFRSNLNFEFSDTFSMNYLLGYAHEDTKPGVIAGLQPFQVNNDEHSRSNAWSHEVNFHYDSERLNAILGLYSFQFDSRPADQLTRLFSPTLTATNRIEYNTTAVDSGTDNMGHNVSKTRAIFGQATFDVTDRFRVTGGARYNWDRVSFAESARSLCPFGSGTGGGRTNIALAPAFLRFPAGTPLCTAFSIISPANFFVRRVDPAGAKSFEKFSWKGTAEYDLSADSIIYATVATGYKAGGAGNVSAVGDARFFRPETNINYEIGVRSKLFDNTLSLNLTGFWTDYKDLQIETTNPDRPSELVKINAGKSRSRGIEFEYIWAPTRADRINGYLTYLDAKFTDFPGARDELTGVIQNAKGNRLPGAPEFSARASYSHIFDLGGAGTITPTASIVYQTKSYVNFTNSVATLIPDYTRSDFIIRYETENKRMFVEGYVNNIENKSRLSQIFPQFQVSNAFFSPPRTYGARVGFRY